MVDLFLDILKAEPTPAPPVERPHELVYYGDGEFDIEHLDTCVIDYDIEPNCGIRFECDNNGLGTFFTDDPYELTGYYDPVLITVPGRYWIEWWQDKSYHYEYGYEYSSGIALMYPEEVTNG